MLYQVVEKEDYGTDWHQVRYQAYAMKRFNTEQEAIDAAKQYLTELNCNNSLAKTDKKAAAEAFMFVKNDKGEVEGCFLGVLDGKDWYLTATEGRGGDRRVVPVVTNKYFELEGKTEVSVRPVPGT